MAPRIDESSLDCARSKRLAVDLSDAAAGGRCMARTGRWRRTACITGIKSSGLTQYLVVLRSKSVGGTHSPPAASTPRRWRRSENTSESAKSAASIGGGDEKSSFASRSSSHVLAAAPPPDTLSNFLMIFFRAMMLIRAKRSSSTIAVPAASASRPDASRSRLAVQSEKWICASVASMDVRDWRTKFATRSSSKDTMRRKPTHGSVSSPPAEI
mmetsp:Transcript_26707/g.84874  ORF Transcript_26707/g.84874 Transcript_26707/m.84874 type:complete len:213 (-) Transcript_26707:173-811(-)